MIRTQIIHSDGVQHTNGETVELSTIEELRRLTLMTQMNASNHWHGVTIKVPVDFRFVVTKKGKIFEKCGSVVALEAHIARIRVPFLFSHTLPFCFSDVSPFLFSDASSKVFKDARFGTFSAVFKKQHCRIYWEHEETVFEFMYYTGSVCSEIFSEQFVFHQVLSNIANLIVSELPNDKKTLFPQFKNLLTSDEESSQNLAEQLSAGIMSISPEIFEILKKGLRPYSPSTDYV